MPEIEAACWNKSGCTLDSIIAMVLVIIVIVLLVNAWPQITATLATMHRLGRGHSSDDKVTGLVTIGLIGALLVAVVRILNKHNPK